MYYEEPEELELELDVEAKKIVNENRRAKTVEEEAEERAYRYKQRKIAQRKKLEMIGAEELHKRYGKALVCPGCGEDFRPNKVCPYCGLRV
jgi:rubrerythrin